MPLTRISITIPERLVRAADQQATLLDRSRSWVLVEALRRYLEGLSPAPAPPAVREPAPPNYLTGLGPSRQAQLEADLRLTPEERVIEAERTVRAAVRSGPRLRDRLLTFDRYEDYLDWRRREDVVV